MRKRKTCGFSCGCAGSARIHLLHYEEGVEGCGWCTASGVQGEACGFVCGEDTPTTNHLKNVWRGAVDVQPEVSEKKRFGFGCGEAGRVRIYLQPPEQGAEQPPKEVAKRGVGDAQPAVSQRRLFGFGCGDAGCVSVYPQPREEGVEGSGGCSACGEQEKDMWL